MARRYLFHLVRTPLFFLHTSYRLQIKPPIRRECHVLKYTTYPAFPPGLIVTGDVKGGLPLFLEHVFLTIQLPIASDVPQINRRW